MSESTKEQSLLNEYGKVEDQKLAEKMAYAEKEVRNTFGKEEENKSEVDKWANEESEGVFHEEVGKEYSEAVKEAQEDAAYREKVEQAKQEISDEVSKAEEETKFTVEIVGGKEGASKEDVVKTKQSDAEFKKAVKNEEIAAEDQIGNVTVNRRAAKKFTRNDAESLVKAALGNDVFGRDDLSAENELKNISKAESEAKSPDIQALQDRVDDELRSTEYALSIFEKGNSEELDALINESIHKGKARKSKNNSKGTKEYLRIRFEDERKILNYVKAQLDLSKSAEEFHNIIRSYLKSVREQKRIELDQAAKNNKTAKPIENKYSAREGVLNSYLPSKKEVKIEPKPKQNQEVFRHMAPIEAQASTDGKEPSKNPTELESDAAETNHKTNGPVYSNESLSDDMRDDSERVMNGKKADKSGNDREVEQKNYKQEWQSLHEKIKQAEKQAIEEQLELPLEDKFEAEQLNIFNQPEIEQKTKKDTKPKTALEVAMENDPFGYWKESQEPAKEGKKKEEPASAEATAGKEKTAEEI